MRYWETILKETDGQLHNKNGIINGRTLTNYKKGSKHMDQANYESLSKGCGWQ